MKIISITWLSFIETIHSYVVKSIAALKGDLLLRANSYYFTPFFLFSFFLFFSFFSCLILIKLDVIAAEKALGGILCESKAEEHIQHFQVFLINNMKITIFLYKQAKNNNKYSRKEEEEELLYELFDFNILFRTF
jgi:hypothetical protein